MVMATGKITALPKMFPNYSDVLFSGSLNTGYTATKPCYFYAVIAGNAGNYHVNVNNVSVETTDNTGSVYLSVANGFLQTGDTLSGSGKCKVFGLK